MRQRTCPACRAFAHIADNGAHRTCLPYTRREDAAQGKAKDPLSLLPSAGGPGGDTEGGQWGKLRGHR